MIYLRGSVGIEVRGEDLLLASLQSNFSPGVFTAFKRISGFSQTPVEEVRNSINSFFRSKGLSRDNIILGIPRTDIILRRLDFPAEVADNIKQVVQYQAQSFEPSEEEKFYSDFVVLKDKPGAKRIAVLLAMVKKSILDERLQQLRIFDIRPVRVMAGSLAMANLFVQGRKDLGGKTFILANLTAAGIEIMALRDGSMVYDHETPKGEGDSWKQPMLREMDVALSKIRLSADEAIEKVMLSGDEAAAAQQEIQEEIGDCELISKSFKFDTRIECRPHLQEAAIALALAYSGMVRRPPLMINLLPAALRTRKARWIYVPTILLGLMILLLLAGLGFRQMIQEQILSRKLDKEIASLQADVDRVRSIKSQSEELEKRIQTLEDVLGKRNKNLEVLQELTSIIPPETYLSAYSMNRDGAINISGIGPAPEALISQLESSPLLKDVKQKGTSYVDPSTGKIRFTFEFKLEK
jgi:Tfp pilus assembly protein PilN